MKILIFGLPGAGKTCLAYTIAERLHLPIFHIDKHFFEKGWIERNHDHFLEDVRTALKAKDWLIEGNGMRSLEMRYKEADVVIYCNLPRILCLYRIFYRWFSTLGQDKADGPEGSSNTVSWRLIKYLWAFPVKYRAKIAELNKRYPQVHFLEIRSRKDSVVIPPDGHAQSSFVQKINL